MSAPQPKNTKGEMVIRRALHHRGLRYRLNLKSLPGTPDIVLPRHRTVVFFNGCFWHQHDCPLFRWPKTREEFWRDKLRKNRERDQHVHEQLTDQGWRVGIVWECSLKPKGADIPALADDLAQWIRSSEARREWRS